MKAIYVKSKDFGFFTQEPITVVVKDIEGEIVYCNHAQADIEEYETWPTSNSDSVVVYKTLTCGKCGAYKPENQSFWEDSPSEGIHE